MAWLCLFVAGLLEIGWPIGMKYTHNFSRLWPTVITFGFMIASFGLLSLAIQRIPVGTAYAVWTGIGAAGTAAVGIWLFKEPASIGRVVCILCIVAGVFGLKFTAHG